MLKSFTKGAGRRAAGGMIAGAALACAACTSVAGDGDDAGDGVEAAASGSAEGEIERFDIAAQTQPCVGVGPMQCLVVNGKFFYNSIEGYTHVEGEAAQICVAKTRRPDPVPADAGIYLYRAVPCP